MKAIALSHVCKAEEMHVSQVDLPQVKAGWVLIRIKAFGLNRAELTLRKHEIEAPYIQKPVIPGIECVGTIEDPSNSHFKKGDKVVALMGGMGRSFNGGYAEYALLPVAHVFSVESDFDWPELGAIPETYFTAYGSLFETLQLDEKDVLLVHGATSALGLAAIQLAKASGCVVIGTTRKSERIDFLKTVGADYAFVDDGDLSGQIKHLLLDGVTKVLELVGVSGLGDISRIMRRHGIICVTGQLGSHSGQGLDIIKHLKNGIYLGSFYSNYPTQAAMDAIFEMIGKHHISPVIGKVFAMEEIGQAHALMESDKACGKLVVRVD